MIEIEEAKKIILDNINCLDIEEISTRESLHRVIAEDVYSDIDIPPFNRATMDGYACISDNVKNTPVELDIIGEISAGNYTDTTLRENTCVRIMTGSPVPKSADCVVMIEDTQEFDNNKKVRIFSPVNKWQNIAKAGEDINKGELAIKRATFLTPVFLGILSAIGRTSIKVFKLPTVALICTGNELVDSNSPISYGKIRNVNDITLLSSISEYTDKIEYLGTVKDDIDKITEVVKLGLTKDLLIISGGVSVGKYDYTTDILKDLGAEIIFHKVSIKPGKPLLFAKYKNTSIFGIPGNPVATLVSFKTFISLAIRKMMGFNYDDILKNFRLKAFLKEDFEIKDKKSHYRDLYQPGFFEIVDGNIWVTPVYINSSADMINYSKSNCTIFIPKDIFSYKKEDKVEVIIDSFIGKVI